MPGEQEGSIIATSNVFEGTQYDDTLALRITSPADSVATFDRMSDEEQAAMVNDLSEVSNNSYVTHSIIISLHPV